MSTKSQKARSLAFSGRTLIASSIGLLTLCGVVANALFPKNEDGAMPTAVVLMLVPVWIVGIAGVVCSLAAWISYPRLSGQLDLDFPSRSDGRYFGRLTRILACFMMTVFCLATLLSVLAPDDPDSFWLGVATFYVVLCLWALTLYLSFFYSHQRHLATTTYLTLLTPFFEFVLIPCVWPVLVWLNLKADGTDESDML